MKDPEARTIHVTEGFGPEGIDEAVWRAKRFISECLDTGNTELCNICVQRARLIAEQEES